MTDIWILQLVGKEAFEEYLRAYLKRFSFKTINSQQFKDFFLGHFQGKQGLDAIDWDMWYFGRGRQFLPSPN